MEFKSALELLRRSALRINEGDEKTATAVGWEFKAFGFVPGDCVGDSDIQGLDTDLSSKDVSDEIKLKVLRWIAGQLLTITEKKSWVAMNSWLNVVTGIVGWCDK